MPAPLAMPPTDQPLPSTTTCLLTVSVVMMARAAAAPPSLLSDSATAPTPASRTSRSLARPMRPVEQTTTSMAPIPRMVTDLLGHRVGRLEAVRARCSSSRRLS